VVGLDPADRDERVGALRESGTRYSSLRVLLPPYARPLLQSSRTAACRRSSWNYAGTAPITRASGKSRVVLARYARNRRLADALYLWSFSALNGSPGVRALYDARTRCGPRHRSHPTDDRERLGGKQLAAARLRRRLPLRVLPSSPGMG